MITSDPTILPSSLLREFFSACVQFIVHLFKFSYMQMIFKSLYPAPSGVILLNNLV